MKIRLGLISWATGTLLLVAVSACGDNGDGSPAVATELILSERADDERLADVAVRRSDGRCDGSDAGLLRGGRRVASGPGAPTSSS